ncbi:MAG TPA: CusA/CzcA family heavy metal efflux RND transporter [Candidatus Saccharimonadales bacterium]|nr:CusA/CzcA family heavy metal efflux RND transporter [Candidatus Saccharimonadales bacterium]
MISKLTSAVLRHRAIVVVLLLVWLFAGANAFRELPVEAYPDVTNVSVQIITLFPGRAAEEVERLVTVPIESAMNGIPQRVSMRSISLFGLSQITLVFEDNARNEVIRNLASQLLGTVTLPTGAQASLSPDATPIGEVYRYTLRAVDGFPPEEVRALEDWVVEKKFRSVPGVVDVNPFGGLTKQYQVLVDPIKLKSYGLSLQQVFTALQNGNANAGGSYVEHGSELYVVRGLGLVRDVSDIASIAVDTRNGTPIRIGNLGRVVIGHAVRLGRVGKTEASDGKILRDEDDVAEGIVVMRRGENPMEVCRRIEKMAAQINERYLPPGVKLVTYYDRTGLTDRTLHTVRENMIEGIALVLLVLILFLGLGNYRSALVVALAVPVSLLGAFLLLDLRGIPANLISMGAIDFGIIVDSAVVVMENLLRILEERRGKIHSLTAVIIEAATEMGRPIIFSKIILLTAFIPLYTMQRVEGRIFRPMALTLTFALIAGTIFAIVVVPALASLVVRGKIATQESWLVRGLLRIYRPALNFAMTTPVVIYIATALLLVAGGVTFALVGSEFLPKLDEGDLWVRTFAPQSISPSESAKITQNVRRRLASFPEVRYVISQLGRPDDGTDINGWDVTEYSVGLLPREKWKTAHTREELCDAMARNLKDIPGIDTQFSQYIEDNVNEAVSGVKSELALKLYGDDPDKLQTNADQIVDIVKTVKGATDVGTDLLLGQPQIQISIDRAAISRYGLAVSDLQTLIATAVGGQAATQVLQGERTFDLVVKLDPKYAADLESIRNIPVSGSNGERLTLGDVARVEVKSGLARIEREENERRTAIKLSVRDRDLGSLVGEAQRKVEAKVHLPTGYRLEWTGSFENEQRAEKRLAVIIPLTIMAIFFLLFIAFDSGKLATLILLTIPCAAAGGLLALPVAGLNLSVAALVGFVAVFGVSIQNSVILVTRIRELRREGHDRVTAIKEGASSRVRPMVMTALMAMLGLLPMAISTGVGAETARPFAVVIIGGLLSGTILTLFILPLLYPFFESKREDKISRAVHQVIHPGETPGPAPA